MSSSPPLDDLLSTLSASSSPNALQIHDEISALLAIYEPIEEEPSLSLYLPPPKETTRRTQSPKVDLSSWDPANLKDHDDPLRLQLRTSIPTPNGTEELPLDLLVSLPPNYPTSSPPLLQLASLYLGPYQISDSLFGDVLRTYMHEKDTVGAQGIEWMGDVCVYEGVEYVKEICLRWYEERKREKMEGEKMRTEASAVRSHAGVGGYAINATQVEELWENPRDFEKLTLEDNETWSYEKDMEKKRSGKPHPTEPDVCPVITTSPPITDRKSVFVGHSASVNSPEDVDVVLRTLLSDKKIARATHNMFAFRYTTTSGSKHHDNDDDGESAAGSRLAHLLSLMELDNVLVVVTRWYGGVHLGSDRFKHINSAAREALELGGFLEDKGTKGGKKDAKKGGK